MHTHYVDINYPGFRIQDSFITSLTKYNGVYTEITHSKLGMHPLSGLGSEGGFPVLTHPVRGSILPGGGG